MTDSLELLAPGYGSSIQDAGRFGYRHMGITISGYLDGVLARCANALVGNDLENDCACIEIRAVGPTLRAINGPVRLALAGDVSATLERADGSSRPVAAWTSVMLARNEVLAIGSTRGSIAYLALAGGIASPRQLGSRSLYERALIGGIGGRPLAAGDRLPCSLVAHGLTENRSAPWQHDDGPIRVMLGPQVELFKPEAVAIFLDSDYRSTPQRDRMGMRLEGEGLAHISAEAADIVSDGVTPGTIQVPGNGQPIVLLADCQTVGGYPKIATVIGADLPRMAQLKAGQSTRFYAVSGEQARHALLAREARWQAWAAAIVAGSADIAPPDDDDSDWYSSNF